MSARSAGRRPIVAANWKMHKTRGEAIAFVERLRERAEQLDRAAEVVICPPFLALTEVAVHAGAGPLLVAAQNMHEAAEGAFTGEVSAAMLAETPVWGVILGHSERRAHFGETDEALSRKVPVALEAGLTPILCVGESEAQRDAGETEAILSGQLRAGLAEVPVEKLGDVVIAYEPIWAIGTGRTASAEQAQEACAHVRSVVADRDPGAAERLRVQYGGSVKPANAAELLSLPDVDGALVGGASLDPDAFAEIVLAAAPAEV